MSDEQLADLLSFLGIIERHSQIGIFPIYSLPMGKMSYIAEEVCKMPHIANEISRMCLDKNFPLRMSKREDGYVVIVERSWITVVNQHYDRAVIEACARTLEGAQ